MSAPPYMPLYVADYLGDTRHLTTEQHGAYVLLLMAMWRGGGRLPAEPARLARLAGLTTGRWTRMAAEVTAFFTCEDGALTSPRLAAELARYARTVDARRVAGAKGAAARNRPANAGAKPAQTGEPGPSPAAGEKRARPRQPEPEPKPEPEKTDTGKNPPAWTRPELDALEAALRQAAGPSLDAAAPALLNLAPVLALLRPGQGPPAELEADVLPAIRVRAAGQRPGTVRSWVYFAPAVLAQRDRRLAGAPEPASIPPLPEPAAHEPSRRPASGRAAKRAVWAQVLADEVLADEAGEADAPAGPPGP